MFGYHQIFHLLVIAPAGCHVDGRGAARARGMTRAPPSPSARPEQAFFGGQMRGASLACKALRMSDDIFRHDVEALDDGVTQQQAG